MKDIEELKWTSILPDVDVNGFQFNPTLTSGTSQYGNIVINSVNTYDDKAVLGWIDSNNILNMYCKYKVGVLNGNLNTKKNASLTSIIDKIKKFLSNVTIDINIVKLEMSFQYGRGEIKRKVLQILDALMFRSCSLQKTMNGLKRF